ncbi:MAG: hypothetical protein A2103_02520 [Gammaproteobacteria bacterium GWF2_41_13]|nr:MAG: hypothetical protein A2103_02520 [Gammaproteobacteria bacterium GWF2_41_13]
MFKHLLFMIGLTLLIIISEPVWQFGLHQLLAFHSYLLTHIASIFSQSKETAKFLERFIAIMATPILISSALSGIYWLFKRRSMPGIELFSWTVWIVLMTALLLA